MDLMIDPEKIYFYLSKLNLKIPEDYLISNYYLIIITLVFIFIIIISNLLKFLLGYLGQVISNNVTHEMNVMLFKNLLRMYRHQPYENQHMSFHNQVNVFW